MTYPAVPLTIQWIAGPPYELLDSVKMFNRIDNNFNLLRSYYQGPYTSYTPGFTSTGVTPSLGAGNSLGIYKIIGDTTCVFTCQLTWGSGFTNGSGIYLIGLPPVPWLSSAILPVFQTLFVQSGGTAYSMNSQVASTTTLQVFHGDGTTASLDATHPVAAASGNVLRINGTYQVA